MSDLIKIHCEGDNTNGKSHVRLNKVDLKSVTKIEIIILAGSKTVLKVTRSVISYGKNFDVVTTCIIHEGDLILQGELVGG